MTKHIDFDNHELLYLIRKGTIRIAGNLRLKIYGTLQCQSGKRMKKINRVFFISHHEAEREGYRPCARCMHQKYQQWKVSKKRVDGDTREREI